jgi:CrcB protein
MASSSGRVSGGVVVVSEVVRESGEVVAVGESASRRSGARGRFGDPRLLVAVFAGGVVGALVRAGLTQAFPASKGAFPWTVLAINVAGAMLLAYMSTRLQERLPPSTYRRPLVGTGFCGALTTFSTMQVQAVRLGHDGHALKGAVYLAVSLLAGLLAAVVTIAATRRARLR